MPVHFASTDELTADVAAAAKIHSYPRPSLLEEPLEGLDALNIATWGDLVEHLPHSHRDRRELRRVAELAVGEEATVAVAVRSVSVKPMRNRRQKRVEARVFDDTGPLVAVWFNQPWLARQLGEGAQLLLHGKLRQRNQFWVTEHELLGAEAPVHTVGLVPVHPATQGVTPQRLRELAWKAYPRMFEAVDPLPARLRAEESLPDRPAALAAAHFPDREEDERDARRRLAFEELFLLQLAVAGRRRARREGRRARALEARGVVVDRWRWSLPFELTGDQQRAIAEIDADLDRERPMQRLLMGEVGSGKAQPYDALVLTPSGFRAMEDIRMGDEVINPTGETTHVTGVFPQGIRDVWRVRFSDGSSVECDAEHLWQVRTSAARHRGDRPKVKPLKELSRDLSGANGAPKWHVELPAPADLEDGGDRPIDPYLLGLLLGDGSFAWSRVRFSTADAELVDAVRQRMPAGCRLRKERHRAYDWNVIGHRSAVDHGVLREIRGSDQASLVRAYEAGASCATIATHASLSEHTVRRRLLSADVAMRTSHPRNPLQSALSALGLLGKLSREKAVPAAYLNASVDARHAILQGLMDTDGTVPTAGNNVTFDSSSEQPARDVAWLARSLGGRASCRLRIKKTTVRWQTQMALPAEFPRFA